MPLVHQVQLVNRALQVPLGLLVLLAQKETVVSQDLLDHLVAKEPQDLPEPPDQTVIQGSVVAQEVQDSQVNLVQLALQDLLVPQGLLELLDPMEHPVFQGLLDQLGHLELQALLAQ